MVEVESAYRELLLHVPGIVSAEFGAAEPSIELTLRTTTGAHRLRVRRERTHLTNAVVEHLVTSLGIDGEPVLLLAREIGAGLAPKLMKAGVNYLDLRGNCHFALPKFFVHVEGKSGPKSTSTEKGLRSAGYQTLFAFLAEPVLLNAPVREVAARAGVSRQAALDLKDRLGDALYVGRTSTESSWIPHRLRDALALWLHGYETTVRPSLLCGTYRTKEADPSALEERVMNSLAPGSYRWGGTAAAFRLTGHYRGERSVLHFEREPPPDLARRLHALSDPHGNLLVLRAPGKLNWDPGMETVHPLLVYSEMLDEGSERAREAARILLENHLGSLAEALR
jgi:hypothetical protein